MSNATEGLTINQLAERNAEHVTTIESLRSQLTSLTSQLESVVAENAALMKFCKDASFDADYEAELGMERGGFTDALNDIKTPATSAFLAEVRASGVDLVCDYHKSRCEALRDVDRNGSQRHGAALCDAIDIAAQLRQGAAK